MQGAICIHVTPYLEQVQSNLSYAVVTFRPRSSLPDTRYTRAFTYHDWFLGKDDSAAYRPYTNLTPTIF